MTKTTVYLPEDLKQSLKLEAADQGVSEAELIRKALFQLVGSVNEEMPPAGVICGDGNLARNVAENLVGFGAW